MPSADRPATIRSDEPGSSCPRSSARRATARQARWRRPSRTLSTAPPFRDELEDVDLLSPEPVGELEEVGQRFSHRTAPDLSGGHQPGHRPTVLGDGYRLSPL